MPVVPVPCPRVSLPPCCLPVFPGVSPRATGGCLCSPTGFSTGFWIWNIRRPGAITTNSGRYPALIAHRNSGRRHTLIVRRNSGRSPAHVPREYISAFCAVHNSQPVARTRPCPDRGYPFPRLPKYEGQNNRKPYPEGSGFLRLGQPVRSQRYYWPSTSHNPVCTGTPCWDGHFDVQLTLNVTTLYVQEHPVGMIVDMSLEDEEVTTLYVQEHPVGSLRMRYL